MTENRNKNFEALVAENRFINDLLVEIERAMADKEWTQADLARALNISPARVCQILSGNGKNLQARTIARIAFHLGVSASVSFLDDADFGANDNICRKSAFAGQIKKWIVGAREDNLAQWPDIAVEGDSEADHEFERREREAA